MSNTDKVFDPAALSNYSCFADSEWSEPEVLNALSKPTLDKLRKIEKKFPDLLKEHHVTAVAPGSVFYRRTEQPATITAELMDNLYHEEAVWYPYETDKDLVLLNIAGIFADMFCDEFGIDYQALGTWAQQEGFDGLLFYSEKMAPLPKQYMQDNASQFNKADDRSGYQAVLFTPPAKKIKSSVHSK